MAIRVRPFVPRENGQKRCVEVIEKEVVQAVNEQGLSKQFAFDYAFDSNSTQAEVYDSMGKPTLQHMLAGYNACLFAYGQTGTGKTTTVMGSVEPVEEQGLLLRLLNDFFEETDRLRSSEKDAWKVGCHVQMLEVYDEQVRDLLVHNLHHGSGNTDKKKNLEVWVHPQLGVYVPGVIESAVSDFQSTLELIEYGNTMKAVAATSM